MSGHFVCVNITYVVSGIVDKVRSAASRFFVRELTSPVLGVKNTVQKSASPALNYFYFDRVSDKEISCRILKAANLWFSGN